LIWWHIWILIIFSLFLFGKKYYHLGGHQRKRDGDVDINTDKTKVAKKIYERKTKIEGEWEVLVCDDWMMQRMIYESWK
jgi:hypothetical protein